jgi:hypothetical protein
MRTLTIVAAVLAGMALLGDADSLMAQKDYYKDIDEATRYFKSSNPTDKSFALATLGLVGAEAKKTNNAALAQYLAKTGSNATVQGLVNADPAIRQAANEAIGTVNPTIAQPVLDLVNGKSYEQKLEGMKEVARLGPLAVAAVPALLSFLKQAKPEDKAGVVQSIATVGAKDPQVTELIAVMALKDPDMTVQRAALASLNKMPDANAAVNVFVGTLNSEQDQNARLAAVRGLATVGRNNPAAIQELQRLAAKDPNVNVQREAKAALDRLKPPD